MKKKKIELGVDFVGDQVPLTREEKKLTHDFFQSNKMIGPKQESEKKRIARYRNK